MADDKDIASRRSQSIRRRSSLEDDGDFTYHSSHSMSRRPTLEDDLRVASRRSHSISRRLSLEDEQSGYEELSREEREGRNAGLSELAAPAPVDRFRTRSQSLESGELRARRSSTRRGDDAFLSEVAGPPPLERESDEDEEAIEDDEEPNVSPDSRVISDSSNEPKELPQAAVPPHSQNATEIYIVSHLIFFSILGTLARLGLQALTFYPGAPVTTGLLWANVGGTFFMGFLAEDQRIFRQEWGTSSFDLSHKDDTVPEQARNSHAKVKKTLPLFIGLATGFCGSFTSFSSFIRDTFLALSNNLPSPVSHPTQLATTTINSTVPRNGGYSFMALSAIIILTISVCASALTCGAHVALALDPIMPTLPFTFCRRILDPVMVFLAWGSWLGAIFLAIWPPDRHQHTHPEFWRSRAVFALVFAPLGCLLRFYASKYLNTRIPAFPLGTFIVNVFGTLVEGMCFDLQHSSVTTTNFVGCQVLQGVTDGFCGCLTTVSTWIAELNGLRRRHAYVYGSASVATALCFLIVIMGSLRWDVGFKTPACTA